MTFVASNTRTAPPGPSTKVTRLSEKSAGDPDRDVRGGVVVRRDLFERLNRTFAGLLELERDGHLEQLQSPDALDAAQPGLGEELRALALISLGIAELWSSRVDEAEAQLERGIASGCQTGRTSPASAADPPEHLPEPLSQAEARVLRFLPTSLSAPEIARELYVSVNTVRTHMRHLYDKLGAHRRLEAIDRARTLGLLAPVPQRALRSLRGYRRGHSRGSAARHGVR
jgi:DNA-binding CsgD family transcriptional regulator